MRCFALCAVAVVLTPLAAHGQDDFRMAVMDAFTISGRGVVVTGIVAGGPVAVNDVICFRPAEGERRELTVVAIERLREMLETAEPGMPVGLLLEGVEASDFEQGDVLTAGCE